MERAEGDIKKKKLPGWGCSHCLVGVSEPFVTSQKHISLHMHTSETSGRRVDFFPLMEQRHKLLL